MNDCHRLQCKRYGMAEHLMEDGSLEFTLE